MNGDTNRWKPAVPRRALWLTAGLLWSGVGIALCAMAVHWLCRDGGPWPLRTACACLGAISGFMVYRHGFSRIARKNANRIAQKSDRVCLFAFQAWKSYILIAVMVGLGYTLRHSPLPRPILAVIYSTIGIGLLLSSRVYYERLR